MSARNRRKSENESGQQRRSRSSLIYTLLNDKVARIYQEQPITLRTRYSQNAYKNGFGVMSEACYRVFEVMPMVSPEFSEKIGMVIENDMNETSTRITEDLAKAYELAEQHGLSIESVSSTVVREVSARVMTPHDMQYLKMLDQLDQLAGIIQGLWMLNKIDSTEKKNILMGWQKHLTKLAYNTRDICIETVRRIADQQKQAEKLAQQRRDIHQKRMENQEKFAKDSLQKHESEEQNALESKEELPEKESKTAAG